MEEKPLSKNADENNVIALNIFWSCDVIKVVKCVFGTFIVITIMLYLLHLFIGDTHGLYYKTLLTCQYSIYKHIRIGSEPDINHEGKWRIDKPVQLNGNDQNNEVRNETSLVVQGNGTRGQYASPRIDDFTYDSRKDNVSNGSEHLVLTNNDTYKSLFTYHNSTNISGYAFIQQQIAILENGFV